MSAVPLYNIGVSTARGLMADLWRDSLQDYTSNDPLYGYRFRTDFLTEQFTTSDGTTNQLTGTTAVTAAGGWTAQDAVTAGGTYTVSILGGVDGYMRMDGNGTTADFGVEVGRVVNNIVLPSHSTTPRGRMVFQTRIDNVDADFHGVMLADAAYNVPIGGATDNPADVGYIGFIVKENNDLYFQSKSATGGTATSILLLASATFGPLNPHNLGFAVNVDRSVDIVVDGVWYKSAAKSITSASLPTGNLSPRFFGTCGDGATAPTIDVDSIDIFVAAA